MNIGELRSLTVVFRRRRSYMIYLDFPGSPPADQLSEDLRSIQNIIYHI